MQKEVSSLLEKIQRIRSANETGDLSSHGLTQTATSEDSAVASSWGPQMRV